MLVEQEWVLVEPLGRQSGRELVRPAPRSSLRRLGFLSNHKPNAAETQEQMAGILARPDGPPPRFYGKEMAAIPAPPELIKTIAEECDLVIIGSAD